MKMSTIDILKLDDLIQSKFLKEKENVHKYKTRLKELNNISVDNLTYNTRKSITSEKEKLTEKINDIESGKSYNIYLAETLPYLTEYRKILDTPVKISFLKKVNTDKIDKDNLKKDLTKKYFNIVVKYINVKYKENDSNNKLTCESCNNHDFDIIENNYICVNCGTIQEVEIHSTSFKDVERINMSTKYTYVRKAHFRDCMNQYQGKQNCNVIDKVYEDLIREFKNHGLLNGDENTPKKERFSRIEKFHVLNFLKELGYTNHYENTIYIHSKITGKSPDDISHLEVKLMNDFITLEKLYYEKYKDNVDRKSFINTNHIFYQLLKKYKHKCNKEDFSLLKTIDRQDFHDEVCENLFKILGWNYTNFY